MLLLRDNKQGRKLKYGESQLQNITDMKYLLIEAIEIKEKQINC